MKSEKKFQFWEESSLVCWWRCFLGGGGVFGCFFWRNEMFLLGILIWFLRRIFFLGKTESTCSFWKSWFINCPASKFRKEWRMSSWKLWPVGKYSKRRAPTSVRCATRSGPASGWRMPCSSLARRCRFACWSRTWNRSFSTRKTREKIWNSSDCSMIWYEYQSVYLIKIWLSHTIWPLRIWSQRIRASSWMQKKTLSGLYGSSKLYEWHIDEVRITVSNGWQQHAFDWLIDWLRA